MVTRIIYGALGILMASLYVFSNNFYISNVYFLVFTTFLAIEFANFLNIKKREFIFILTFLYLFLISILLIYFYKLPPSYIDKVTIFIIFLHFFSYSVFLILKNKTKKSLNRTIKQIFVLFYLIVVFFQLIKVRHLFWYRDGIFALDRQSELLVMYYAFFPFFISWSIDAGAFFGGTLIGGKKLGLEASPNKTWSGLIVGVLVSFAGFYAYKGIILFFHPELLQFTFFYNRSTLWVAIFSLIIFALGFLGDLIASIHKRSVNVKDSGTFLKGHGGVYDRLDSTLIINFFYFYYLNEFFLNFL